MNLSQKKELNNKIKNINDNNLYYQIYNIVKIDSNFKPTQNNNGIYFNFNLLDDITLTKIDELLTNEKTIDVKEKLEYKSYYIETFSNKLKREIYKLNR